MSETTNHQWAWQTVYPAAMIEEDAPRLAAQLVHEQESASHQAAEQGYTLIGEPKITTEPLALVPDWRDTGPAMVGLAFARMGGYEGDPTHYRYLFLYDALAPVPSGG